MAVTGKGAFGWRGPRGYSAYDLAVQDGFIGTMQDWLATLGTSSHFSEDKTLYTTTTENETVLDLPNEYTSNSFIDIYVEGNRLDSSKYSINTSTRKITLTNPLAVVGTKVEIVCLTMSTNTLEISETINESSTNETSAGAKAVFDYVEAKASTLLENIPKEIIDDTMTSTSTTYSSAEIVDLFSYANLDIANKLNKSNIKTVTGSTSGISAGATEIVDVAYPVGFNKTNTLIVGKMTSSNNVYYDSVDLTPTTNGFPVIKMIALTDSTIRLWLQNNNTEEARVGHYKITLLKTE